jgi:hypothetical protein
LDLEPQALNILSRQITLSHRVVSYCRVIISVGPLLGYCEFFSAYSKDRSV